MFSRKRTAERTAAQAWDYLSNAVAAAGDTARSAGRETARTAGRKGGQLADVASDTTAKLADGAGRRGTRLAARAGRRGSAVSEVAGHKAGAIADEAMRRANAAADALAGRRPGLPWAVIVAAGLLGVALGWTAAATARAALARRAENEQLELAETPAEPLPTFDN